MPDPEQARAAVEMVMATLFDVFRDTRLEPFASDLAWGFVNSFHVVAKRLSDREDDRSEEHTSELQSLMRISYAVFCLKKKKNTEKTNYNQYHNTVLTTHHSTITV